VRQVGYLQELNQDAGQQNINITVITLVDLQLDAQNSCLFTYNTFINP